jgi:hypothetical protein
MGSSCERREPGAQQLRVRRTIDWKMPGFHRDLGRAGPVPGTRAFTEGRNHDQSRMIAISVIAKHPHRTPARCIFSAAFADHPPTNCNCWYGRARSRSLVLLMGLQLFKQVIRGPCCAGSNLDLTAFNDLANLVHRYYSQGTSPTRPRRCPPRSSPRRVCPGRQRG